MNKPLATLGLLAFAGALSLCGLCGPAAGAASGGAAMPGGLVSVAYAAPAQPRPRAAQAPAQATAARTTTFVVRGMDCGGCVVGVRKVLTRLPGVAKADVSYEKRTAVVTYDPRKVTVEQMVAAIKTLGYTATPVAPAAGGATTK